jgi:D-hydroxyproline dehydrogenase subunit alpha
VPLMLGQVVSEALGTDAVEAVRICRSDFRGEARVLACDALGVCYGFLASSELARQAGARSVWEAGSGWVVAADDLMRSSVPGMSVAGELIGVAGAMAAALSGEIAGLGIAVDCGRLAAGAALPRARVLRGRLERVRRFARLLSRLSSPAPELLRHLASPSTLLCRCEEVTVEELTAALRHDPGIASASAAKLLTRVGMGACQGRMCETAVRWLIAASRGSALSEIAGYVPRAPVKPVSLAALAAESRAMPIDSGAHVA